MKTPREILLRRHQTATPKLDAVRRAVLAAPAGVAAPRPAGAQDQYAWPARAALVVWRELIQPCRRSWAALAAVWLVVLGAHRFLLEQPETPLASRSAPGSAMVQSFKEQRRLLAELIPPSDYEPAESSRRSRQSSSDSHTNI